VYNITGGQRVVQELSQQHLVVFISAVCYTETACCIHNYLDSLELI